MKFLLKSLSYRAVSLLASVAVAAAVTGSVAVAIKVGLAGSVVKIGLYAAHEWAWEKMLAREAVVASAPVASESVWAIA